MTEEKSSMMVEEKEKREKYKGNSGNLKYSLSLQIMSTILASR